MGWWMVKRAFTQRDMILLDFLAWCLGVIDHCTHIMSRSISVNTKRIVVCLMRASIFCSCLQPLSSDLNPYDCSILDMLSLFHRQLCFLCQPQKHLSLKREVDCYALSEGSGVTALSLRSSGFAACS